MSWEANDSGWRLTTPVALLVFNRPATTARVFDAVRRARPPVLLLVADGPRADCPGDPEKCAAVREIVGNVDWPCEVLKNFADTNLGCKRRVSSGITWVFEQVESAIILEDDCLPHPTFFRFCEEILHRYRDDERVMMVSGNNFQFGRRRSTDSYYFSRYTHIWGWGTWRRAWRLYDAEMKLWPQVRDGGWLRDILGDRAAANFWRNTYELTYDGQIDTWDFQWVFAAWINSGLTVLPNVNLVTNIGFGTVGTHGAAPKTDLEAKIAALSAEAMESPLRHPPFVVRDAGADAYTQRTMFGPRSLMVRLRSRFQRAWVLGGSHQT